MAELVDECVVKLRLAVVNVRVDIHIAINGDAIQNHVTPRDQLGVQSGDDIVECLFGGADYNVWKRFVEVPDKCIHI